MYCSECHPAGRCGSEQHLDSCCDMRRLFRHLCRSGSRQKGGFRCNFEVVQRSRHARGVFILVLLVLLFHIALEPRVLFVLLPKLLILALVLLSVFASPSQDAATPWIAASPRDAAIRDDPKSCGDPFGGEDAIGMWRPHGLR